MVFSSGFQSERWDGVAAVSGAAAARPADGRRIPASRPLPLTLIQHYRAEYTEVYEERIYALKCGLPEAIGQFLTGGPGRVPAGLPPTWVPNTMFVVDQWDCAENKLHDARERVVILTCHMEVTPWRASRPALRAGRRGKARALGRGELNTFRLSPLTCT